MPMSSDGSIRWSNSSGRSSNGGNIKPDAGNDVDATTSSSTPSTPKRRRKASAHHSPLSQIKDNHPKSAAPPPNYRTLTRKQILRLTPKQRKNLYNQRRQDYEDSRSYLDQARTNARKNLKFLGDRADTNLKKNIATMKRLFKGEEVWNDVEKPSAKHEEGLADMARGIEWERAPAEIKANFLSNISKIQNWLHKTTDGMIPSSQYVGMHGEGDAAKAGSIATRVQQFHEMKQSQTLVMDNKWKAKQICIALLPGLLLQLYFQSKQEEMKAYYKRLEERERQKIVGLGASGDGANASPLAGNEQQSGGMSMSTALITEGGSTWDKLKMTVSDLFLGGAQERIDRHQAKPSQAEQENAPNATSTESASNPKGETLDSKIDIADGTTTAEDSASVSDPTIQMLLERIQALEGQLGERGTQTTVEQRQKEHGLKYQLQRQHQSPIGNRRDDQLRKQWQQEASEREAQEVDSEAIAVDGRRSYSFMDVVNFAKATLEPQLMSMKDSAMQTLKDAANALGLSVGATTAADETDTKSNEESSGGTSEETQNTSPAGPELASSQTIDSQIIAVDNVDASNAAVQQVETKPNGIWSWAASAWRRIRRPRDATAGENEEQ
ncbi:hypothetical protein ACHAXT_012892 [Thalassiosira profunda]